MLRMHRIRPRFAPQWRMRKIVHVDMDAFYASVEQRDDASLRGRPVVVAWKGPRSVVCAASYEARRYGVRSAMSAMKAERLCPQAVFVPPDFGRYRAVSKAVRAIFETHTELIEPLSLDEAYLDVSADKLGLGSATQVATAIRDRIREELQLTASAGIAPNKFLAKIASDWRKPDGQFVIRPEKALEFLAPLPVGRLPGVGKVMEQRLHGIGVQRVGQIRSQELGYWTRHFGRFGQRLHELAHGVDEDPVHAERPTQQISCEDTLESDLPLAALDALLPPLVDKCWQQYAKDPTRIARSVHLKLKTSDFRILSRTHTPETPPAHAQELLEIAQQLLDRVGLPDATRYRLLGVGLGSFIDRREFHAQPTLFV